MSDWYYKFKMAEISLKNDRNLETRVIPGFLRSLITTIVLELKIQNGGDIFDLSKSTKFCYLQVF